MFLNRKYGNHFFLVALGVSIVTVLSLPLSRAQAAEGSLPEFIQKGDRQSDPELGQNSLIEQPGLSEHGRPEGERYLSAEEIESWMSSFAGGNENVAKKQIGTSSNGRPISVLKICPTDLALVRSTPVIYVASGLHGNEKPGVNLSLALARYLSSLVSGRAALNIRPLTVCFVIQPLANPDGYELGKRRTSKKEDLNRDFPYPGRTSPSLLSPEARAISSTIRSENVVALLDIHSGIFGVLWPNGYTSDPPKNEGILRKFAQMMGRGLGTSFVKQMWKSYPSEGTLADFAHEMGAVAITYEIAASHTPTENELPGVLGRAFPPLVKFVNVFSKWHARKTVANVQSKIFKNPLEEFVNGAILGDSLFGTGQRRKESMRTNGENFGADDLDFLLSQ